MSKKRVLALAIGLVALVVAIVMPFGATDFQLAIMVSILLSVVGAVAANLLIGTANQASIGNAAFLAIGAFSAARVSETLHLPFLLSVLAGGVVAAIIGMIVALPAARVRGLYLIIATLALHFITLYVLTRYQSATVGIGGFTVPPVTFGGLTLQQSWWYIAVIAAVASVLIMRNLLRSRFGRAWSALARDEVAARALGVNLFWQKFSVFGFTSFLIGIQGALLGYYVGVVSSDQFTFDMAVSYVAMVVVGGLGSVLGSVLGAIFVTGLPYLVSYLVGFLPSGVATGLTTRLFAVETLLYGVAIIAFIVFEPRGLVDMLRRLVDFVRYRIRRPAPAAGQVAPTSAPAAAAPPDSVLVATGLRVTYNHLSTAIDDITVSVGAGEIVVMLGANGAGKTTTLRGITGFLPAENAELTRGEVRFNGERVNGLRPFQLARRGLVLVPERDKVFRTLTVEENLAVVPTRPGGNRAEMLALVDEVFPALRDLRDRKAGFLSGGERQMLAIAKALVADPVLLLVDELSLGIAPFLVTRLVQALDDIRRARGLGILLVEQNAVAALAIADRGYVLQTGRIVLHGTGAELRANPEVQRLYLGGGETRRYGRLDAGPSPTSPTSASKHSEVAG